MEGMGEISLFNTSLNFVKIQTNLKARCPKQDQVIGKAKIGKAKIGKVRSAWRPLTLMSVRRMSKHRMKAHSTVQMRAKIAQTKRLCSNCLKFKSIGFERASLCVRKYTIVICV